MLFLFHAGTYSDAQLSIQANPGCIQLAYLIPGKAHAPERLVHGVLAHRPAAGVEGREHVACDAAVFPQLAQIVYK